VVKIITAKELAEALKVSEPTIYKLDSSGEIPGFKIGDSWLFELEEIQKLIRESNKTGKTHRDPVEEKAARRLAERAQ